VQLSLLLLSLTEVSPVVASSTMLKQKEAKLVAMETVNAILIVASMSLLRSILQTSSLIEKLWSNKDREVFSD
jgi:hypothetical protein